ncbi:toll-like receptor 2 [Hemicordylus capensis]|uniref:toll-like receptor 2 n=1 Tax=Hemicordylus capensis TaxID=884348 RepID=UPI0023032C0C|nr:toll-like receptor 2 [Hemicordylus capensis]
MLKPDWSLWFLSVVRAVSLFPPKTTPSCDATHFCSYSSMSLHAIPSGLMDDVTGLDLASNRIEQVREMDLKFAVNLITLLLQFNQIRTIDENAFRFLVKLEHLDLSNNNLTHMLPAWFRHLSSLQQLNLKGNYYTQLGETTLFSDLQKLKYLHLGNDFFSTLRKQDLTGISHLETLEIEGQHLNQYDQGALDSIKHINHIILNVSSIGTLLMIIFDVRTSVECLEVQNIKNSDVLKFDQPVPFNQHDFISAHKIILRNIELSDMAFLKIARVIAIMSQLQELELEDIVFHGNGYLPDIKNYAYPSLKIITIRNLRNNQFYSFSDLSTVRSLVGNIVKLTVENTQVYLVPCELASSFSSLQYLDLSVNLLQDFALRYSLCANGWPKLKTLNISRNSLQSFKTVVESVANLITLTSLDISQHDFMHMPELCEWPANLTYLNISGCKLDMLTACIPQTLKVLDVSSNDLAEFRLSLPQLQELYLTSNKLKTLPDATFIPYLRVLTIRENTVMDFTEQQLANFAEMEALDARFNSFTCQCVFLSFIQSHQRIPNILVGWPENYICDRPPSVKGKQVNIAKLTLTECHRSLVVSLICILMLLSILAGVILCYKLHGIWYIQMTWAWLQAKRKPQRAPNKEICYDAFVSYSEHDSEWVESVMVQELEQANPPFKLCLHKRDFIPGKWIVDNIIDSIEKSCKTLFVLSEHFVQSEWCKYELDFSHFRLFDENNDAVILILLEPIPEKTLPKRFCKLRKLMNTKTYLEWPRDEDQQQIFWFNLKVALKS